MTTYIAGPWEWDDLAGAVSGYRAPAGCTALVDLRTIPQQSAPQHTGGLGNGFFCMPDDQPVPSGYTLLGSGDLREINTNQQNRSAWQSLYGVTPQGDHLIDYLAYTLTDGSDPEGATAPKPLDMCPETGDILLAGHSVVWSRPLDVRGSNARWALMLRDMIRKDLQRQAEQDGDVQWRKMLATIKWKYGRQRWNDADGEEIWLTPQMRARGRGPNGTYAIEPATTYTESWPTNGAVTSGQDRTWTIITGTSTNITVSSGLLKMTSGGYETSVLRMNSALSGTDVYVQTTLKALSGNARWGVICRKDSSDSTATYYYALWRSTGADAGAHDFYKSVSGILTYLGEAYPSSQAIDDVLKFKLEGSSAKTYRNGVQVYSGTDTAITSGTYCGEWKYGMATDNYRNTDMWECGDIGGGGGGARKRSILLLDCGKK